MAVVPAGYLAARAALEASVSSGASGVTNVAAPALVVSGGLSLKSSFGSLISIMGRLNATSSTNPSIFAAEVVRSAVDPAAALMSGVLPNEEPVGTFKISAMVIAIVAALSTLMVLFLILQLIPLFVLYRDEEKGMDKVFIKTQLGLYTFCLLLSNLFQGLGGVLELFWALRAGSVGFLQTMSTAGFSIPTLNPTATCSAQAYLLQLGDVGTATWACVIAIHTFRTLVLRRKFSFRVVFLIIAVLWSFIIFDVLVGPLILQNPGVPFYGPVFTDDPNDIAPLWCWITVFYPTERFATHYVLMLISAVISSTLYALVYLALRNRASSSGIVSFQPDWSTYEMFVSMIARRMLLYPLAYVALILPMTLCRFFSLAGFRVPFWAWIASAGIMGLTGLINGILLIWTSKVVQPSHWRMLLYSRTRGEAFQEGSFVTVVQPSANIPTAKTTAAPHRPPLPTIITELPPEKVDPLLEKASPVSGVSISGMLEGTSDPTKRTSIAETVNTFFSSSPLRLLPPSPLRSLSEPVEDRQQLPVPSPNSPNGRRDRRSRRLTAQETQTLLSRFPLPPPAALPELPSRSASLSRKSIEAMFAALPAGRPKTNRPRTSGLTDIPESRRQTLLPPLTIPGALQMGLPTGPASMRAEMLRRKAEKLQLPSPNIFRSSEDGHSVSSTTPLSSPLPDDSSDVSTYSAKIHVRHVSNIYRSTSMRSSSLHLDASLQGDQT